MHGMHRVLGLPWWF